MKLRKMLFMFVSLTVIVGIANISQAIECGGDVFRYTIEKKADYSSLNLSSGQSFNVNYTVTVNMFPDEGSLACWAYIIDTARVNDYNPYGILGWVIYGEDMLPKTFSYSNVVGPYRECGRYQFINTARLWWGLDDPTTPGDTWVIDVNVPCEGGCTLTPGYWKTHSKFGPAPYDDTWAKIGEDTIFFLSQQSWYKILWTSPSGGNAYYILAHAYIASKLNEMNESASPPEVDTAKAWAESFFSAKTPSAKLNKSLRTQVIYYAGILDQYNNGIIGPGHCSE